MTFLLFSLCAANFSVDNSTLFSNAVYRCVGYLVINLRTHSMLCGSHLHNHAKLRNEPRLTCISFNTHDEYIINAMSDKNNVKWLFRFDSNTIPVNEKSFCSSNLYSIIPSRERQLHISILVNVSRFGIWVWSKLNEYEVLKR